MATTPNKDKMPSNAVQNLLFNSEKMDEVINSESYDYVDRLGKNRRTLAGIERDASRAMLNYGYITKDSFEAGATLITSNTVLRWRFNGEYYRWDGDWSGPKVVPAGSTPESTGGMGQGKWVGVGDGALRTQIAGTGGAGSVGTESGLTVEEALLRRSIFAVDYLPKNYVTDGSVSYTPQLQTAIDEAARINAMLVMPGFQVLVDVTLTRWGGLDIPSGSHIKFNPNSSLKLKPNSLSSYEILSIRDKENVMIENAKVHGDKYTHQADAGEWGMGISVRGKSKNIRIINPEVYDCWGDGYYVGQTSDTRDSTPTDVHFINPKAINCRRQGMSVTSADGLIVDNPVFKGTKSSDSRFALAGGPHAGIDIEPNHYNSMLRGIVINNIQGSDNDGGLFYVYLTLTDINAPEIDNTYDVDIKINRIQDNGSRVAAFFVGAGTRTNYNGTIVVNDLVSNNVKANGIRFRNWPNNSVPVLIDSVYINDWNKGGSSLPESQRAPIAIDQESTSAGYDIGGIDIRRVFLRNRNPSMDPSLLFTRNEGGKVLNVDVEMSSLVLNKGNCFLQNRSGMPSLRLPAFDKSALIKRTTSWSQSASIINDNVVDKPDVQVTLTLPDSTSLGEKSNGWFTRVRMINGTYTNFRIRSTTVPMYMNGVIATNVLAYQLSGVILIEFDGYAYYLSAKGPITKES